MNVESVLAAPVGHAEGVFFVFFFSLRKGVVRGNRANRDDQPVAAEVLNDERGCNTGCECTGMCMRMRV